MKLTFIKVGMGGARSADAMEPLAFAVLAGMTPAEIDVDFYDERIEVLPEKIETDWVIFSANTFTIKRTYHLSQFYRDQGIKTAIGGFHATILPEEAEMYCDTVFVGDAEGVWLVFLEDLLRESSRKRYEYDGQPSIRNTQYDCHIFRDIKYNRVKPLQFSRGCRYSCDFCSIHSVYGNSLRFRDVAKVTEEIEERRLKLAFIVDDNLFLDRDRLMAYLKGIQPAKMKWVCQISMDVAKDKALLAAMVKAGCIAVLVGFESMNSDNLIQMKKGANRTMADYKIAIDNFQANGLMIYGTFVIGYDKDGEDTFDQTLSFALEHKFFIANFNPLLPTPGTALYNRLEEEGRLIYKKWWLEPDYRYGETVFRPANMSPKALEEGCFRIRQRFNTYRNIGKRYMDMGPNMGHPMIHFAANAISRREIMRKQGRPL